MRTGAALLLAVLSAACGHRSGAHGKRVIVLGVDGMDPGFVEEHWSDLPNLRRLAAGGGFARLATTTPPQSPVAWSTFIIGADPERHGIFDFVHRDAATLQPLSSLAGTQEPERQLRIGPYTLPLSKARVKSFREGKAFWQLLSEHGVPVTVIRMPGNYPPLEGEGRELAGMGTPDLRGDFGTFTFYTDDLSQSTRDVPGGRIVAVKATGQRVILPVEGPPNTLRRDRRPASLQLIADIDPNDAVARFQIGEQQFILRQGEWSGWVRVRFPLIPGLASAAGMFRVYARRLQPGIQIYVSPLNLDPFDPALPISNPAGYSRELAARIGPFYTQGIEEDTSALRQGALDLGEYLEQSRSVARERRALLQDCLGRFGEGLLFFYFSEIDQNSHMLWGRHNDELLRTYQSVDESIGRVLDQAGGATVIVMSDHGFAAFERAVNLNTWLWRAGFLNLDDPRNVNQGEMFAHVDWSRTKAYAMGLNGLYLNLAGRERNGTVPPSDRETVRKELARRLRDFRDLENDRSVIADVSEIGPTTSPFAPDLIVGYAAGYRASWQTALGAIPPVAIEANTDAWIGDHCISAAAVPGVFLSNRAPRILNPRLKDLTVTILKEFGVAPAEGMNGQPVY